jgi:hypothetical protein
MEGGRPRAVGRRSPARPAAPQTGGHTADCPLALLIPLPLNPLMKSPARANMRRVKSEEKRDAGRLPAPAAHSSLHTSGSIDRPPAFSERRRAEVIAARGLPGGRPLGGSERAARTARGRTRRASGRADSRVAGRRRPPFGAAAGGRRVGVAGGRVERAAGGLVGGSSAVSIASADRLLADLPSAPPSPHSAARSRVERVDDERQKPPPTSAAHSAARLLPTRRRIVRLAAVRRRPPTTGSSRPAAGEAGVLPRARDRGGRPAVVRGRAGRERRAETAASRPSTTRTTAAQPTGTKQCTRSVYLCLMSSL